MSRTRSTFRKRDLLMALQAAQTAGLTVARVEIDKAGRIVMVTGETAPAAQCGNEWDEVLHRDKD
jgi:hypothetical protein